MAPTINTMEQIYAVYRGEKYVDSGTAKELARKMDVTPRTIRFYTSPSYKRRSANPKNPENSLIVIAIGPDDE